MGVSSSIGEAKTNKRRTIVSLKDPSAIADDSSIDADLKLHARLNTNDNGSQHFTAVPLLFDRGH